MIGPILVLISWILLKLEGKGLGALGFNAPRARLRQFIAGLLVAGAVAVLQHLGRSLVTDIPWALNTAFDTAQALEHLRWNTNSVLYEELLFRGYLLYQAICLLGVWRGSFLGAAAFGVYHWFSYGVFGNPVMMGFIFLFTGAFGLMLALAFARTKSIAAPIGLHLGWNLVTNVVFSSGPLGEALLVPAHGEAVMELNGVAALLINLLLPLLLVAVVSWYLVRKKVQNGVAA